MKRRDDVITRQRETGPRRQYVVAHTDGWDWVGGRLGRLVASGSIGKNYVRTPGTGTTVTGPNVVVVVMDTARASNVLPAEGGVMGALGRIASEGITYENAITTAPWTLPSHASLFTGQYTSDHDTHAGTKRFDPDHEPLAARLRGAGYRTVGISNNSWVSPEFGFGRGFDDFYMGNEPMASGADLINIIRNHDGRPAQFQALARKMTATNAVPTLVNAFYARYLQHRYDDGARLSTWRAKRWLDREWGGDRPFFMFVNYVEPHLDYHPPEPFRSRYLPPGVTDEEAEAVDQSAWEYVASTTEMAERDFEILEGLYDAELAYLDRRIGELYDTLVSRDLLEETVLVITSDHGENIGEHGLMDHQYCLYDTLLRVPLIVRLPGGAQRGRTEKGIVELRDLFPTLLGVAGVDGPGKGRISTQPLPGVLDAGDGSGQKDETDDDNREYAISEYVVPQPSIESLSRYTGVPEAELTRFDRGLRCIRTRRWKYVESSDGSEELYDLANDPDEIHDVLGKYPERADELRGELEAHRGEFDMGGHENTTEMKATTKERLEDLGYI